MNCEFLTIIKNLILLSLLKLKRTYIGIDPENDLGDYTCITHAKSLFSKIYVIRRLLYRHGELIDDSRLNLLDLVNGEVKNE